MKTYVEFRSTAFPAYEGEEYEINPGRWGRRLAEFLKSKLDEANIPTDDIYCEDWGVVIPIINREFSMWIGCYNCDEYEDSFLCFIKPSKPFVYRWFRRISTTDMIEKVSDALNGILVSRPDIRAARWFTEEEYRLN